MKKVLINYGGVIFLYLVIFFGVVAISNSVKTINGMDSKATFNK